MTGRADGGLQTGILVRGKYVLTDARRGEGAVIEDAALAIRGDKIEAAAPYDELRSAHPDWNLLGSASHIIMPGFVNAHHHGYGLTSLQLGMPDDHLESWLVNVRSGTQPVDPYLDTLYSAIRLLRSGTTTVLQVTSPRTPQDLDPYIRGSLRAYADVGMRVALAVGVMDQNQFVYAPDGDFLTSLPPALADTVRQAAAGIAGPDPGEVMNLARSLAEEHRYADRVRILLCPLAPQWCSDELLGAVAELASASGIGVHLHCLESVNQLAYAKRTYDRTTLEHLADFGLVGPHVSLAHGVWLSKREIELCAETGTSVCHNASSNMRLRVGVMPLPAMLAAGVNVAIGTDSMGINDDDDPFQEMRVVADLHRRPPVAGEAPPPASLDVLAMATANGGPPTSFGRGVGTLTAGATADMVALDGKDLLRGANPRIGLADILLRWGRTANIDVVLVGGEVVVSGGRAVRFDEGAILQELLASAARLADPRATQWAAALRAVKPYIEAYYRTP